MGLFSRKTKTPSASPPITLSPIPPDFRPLSWDALTTPAHERSKGWYLKGGIAILVMAAWGIVIGAWTFSLVLLLIGGIYFLLRSHTPSPKQIEIGISGITLDKNFTPWSSLRSFWIIKTPSYSELHVRSTFIKTPSIVIQTGFTDLTLLRKTLSSFLPEESNREESLLDMIIRICKL